jgi:superfamily II DNA/RNA helicase
MRRTTTLSLLHQGRLKVLVSTNLASHGLNTPNVGCVVQFDLAKTANDFLTRVGRVGRMGAPGVMLNFVREVVGKVPQEI